MSLTVSPPQLIFPPFADPTWPYGSLPTLKGYLAQRHLEVVVRDFNSEALPYLAAPATSGEWRKRLRSRLRELEKREELTALEGMEYRRLAEAMGLFRDFAAPLAHLRNPSRFYRQSEYQENRDCLEDLFRIMEAVFFPFRFSFNRADHLLAPWDFELLEYYLAGRRSPLEPFYRARLAELTVPPFIGLSLTFVSQLPETFYLCRLIQEFFPDCFLLLGGPGIDLMVRHGQPEAVAKIFAYTDGVCLQEGEETLAQLLPLLAPGRGKPTPDQLRAIPNLLWRDPASGELHRGPSWVLDLAHAPAPDYSDLPLARYPAPEAMLLYSPTRGCYWNKCSFCGYGFNQSGAHAYREIPAAQAAADLAALQERYGANNFYLSCDVLAPAYAFRLAEEIITRGLTIRWSTDLRIEAAYTPERCALLHRSGLRAVAFGIESGAESVLRLMGKGISPELIRTVNRNFHQAGIATAWMTFLNHPGEGYPEAKATLELLAAENEHVDQFIVGSFNLTPGSRIACQPEEFGIRRVYHTAGDLFRLFPLHLAPTLGEEEQEEIEEGIAELSRRYELDHYPWAGAISTHHSFLYLLAHGQRVFAQPWPRPKPGKGKKAVGNKFSPRFSLAKLRKEEKRLLGRYLATALRPGKKGRPAPLSFAHFREFMAQAG